MRDQLLLRFGRSRDLRLDARARAADAAAGAPLRGRRRLLLTLATALLRMAFGGHYLSDVALAAVFTVLIVLAGYRWYARGDSRWI